MEAGERAGKVRSNINLRAYQKIRFNSSANGLEIERSEPATAGKRSDPRGLPRSDKSATTSTPKKMTTREATIGDLPAILALYAQPAIDDGRCLELDQAARIIIDTNGSDNDGA